MPTSAERHRLQQMAVASKAKQQVAQAWQEAEGLPPERVAAIMAVLLAEVAGKFGDAAGSLAADFYDSMREAANPGGTFTPEIAPLPDEGRFESLAGWGVGPLFGSDPDPAAAQSRMSGGLARVVHNVGRDTITNAVDMDPAFPTYARHASANACAFCALLATRGAVYTSAENAGLVTGESLGGKDYRKARRLDGGVVTPERRAEILRGSRAKTVAQGGRKGRPTKRAIGEKYHDDCHCTVVPVWPGQEYDEAPYVEKWRDAYANADSSNNLKAALSSMREELGTK